MKIINYGQFSRPFLNYIVDYLKNESTKQREEIIDYIDVLKLKWDTKYEEALEKIRSNKRIIKRWFVLSFFRTKNDYFKKVKRCQRS